VIEDVLSECRHKMQASVQALKEELTQIRTGRASPGLVEKLEVEYYGQPTALIQLASISVPEPRQLLIRPFDAGSVGDIEKAILTSDLGLTPNNDGKVIRLNLPMLTEERRKELVKVVGARVEEARIAVRNVRQAANKDLRELESEKMISLDDLERGEKDVQQLTEDTNEELEQIGQTKEKEVMEV
jgi:ribosome recycling factor